VGAVSLDGRSGPDSAPGGDGSGHHPLDISLYLTGGWNRVAHNTCIRAPSENRAHGARNDRLAHLYVSVGDRLAHRLPDCISVCVPVCERFVYSYSVGLAVFVSGSADAAALRIFVVLWPFQYRPSGDDKMDGGPGDDNINGSSDHDQLSGGAGADRLQGSGEDDILDARDGEVDIAIDCGENGGAVYNETVFYDVGVDPEPINCEVLNPPSQPTP
jgi:hypothetical protein